MSELETKKGILKKVSKYKGLMLENEEWINCDNNIKDSINIDKLKALIDTEIEVELSGKGYWLEVKAVFKEASELKRYTKTKTFSNKELKKLEVEINNFAKCNKVKATQTHVWDSIFYAFVYYEVEE